MSGQNRGYLKGRLQTVPYQSLPSAKTTAKQPRAQAKFVSEPEDKPWKLREFIAADPDGNLIRVFYDFRGDSDL
jgi:hypothetical protein